MLKIEKIKNGYLLEIEELLPINTSIDKQIDGALDVMKKFMPEITNFVGMVFKSPIYRKSISNNETWNTYFSGNEQKVHKTGEFCSEEKTII